MEEKNILKFINTSIIIMRHKPISQDVEEIYVTTQSFLFKTGGKKVTKLSTKKPQIMLSELAIREKMLHTFSSSAHINANETYWKALKLPAKNLL